MSLRLLRSCKKQHEHAYTCELCLFATCSAKGMTEHFEQLHKNEIQHKHITYSGVVRAKW